MRPTIPTDEEHRRNLETIAKVVGFSFIAVVVLAFIAVKDPTGISWVLGGVFGAIFLGGAALLFLNMLAKQRA